MMDLIKARKLLLLLAIFVLSCGPRESALVVHVSGWPDGEADMRLTSNFAGSVGQPSTIKAGTPEFSVVVPSGQQGLLYLEAMITNQDGCSITRGTVAHNFDGGIKPERYDVELALTPYPQPACTGWVPSPSGVTSPLRSVWGASSSDIWAVGDAGVIVHWNGSSWMPVETTLGRTLNAVWGSPGNFWAVGSGGIIRRWNGMAWSTVTPAVTPNALHGVWGQGNEVWAVGDAGTIVHYDGTQWSTSNPTTQILYSIWGSSSRDIWVVGDNRATLRWDGSTWTPGILPGAGFSAVLSISGSRDRDLWAVGASSGIWRYDGIEWVNGFSAAGAIDIRSVWTGDKENSWAIAGAGAGGPRMIRWNGTAWSPIALGAGDDLNSIWGVSNTDLWAVGDGGTILHYQP